jgi:hypothetical protein
MTQNSVQPVDVECVGTAAQQDIEYAFRIFFYRYPPDEGTNFPGQDSIIKM